MLGHRVIPPHGTAGGTLWPDDLEDAVNETSPAPALVCANAAAWRAWLDAHEGTNDGVWLTLAKKGVDDPTSLTYAQALDEALCSGWIDGQMKSIDAATYQQRCTPRRKRSLWSARNVDHVARLTEEGRMRASGLAEVERAQADGRWDAAYAGQATMAVPEDLDAALAADATARTAFETLNAQNRYAILHRITTATSAASRSSRLERMVAMLGRGETPYP